MTTIIKELLLLASVNQVRDLIKKGHLMEMAQTLGAFWSYDYQAAKRGRVGYHALLKSGLHSDGFFVSRILLEPENMLVAVADEMSDMICNSGRYSRPDFVVGVPDGATKLGRKIAENLSTAFAEMSKVDGRIVLDTMPSRANTFLVVEDICTRGTGFKEAVIEILKRESLAGFIDIDPVVLNRGGLEQVEAHGLRAFRVISLVDKRIQDWSPEECPLCKMGSKPIKPKATDENWRLITTAQLL